MLSRFFVGFTWQFDGFHAKFPGFIGRFVGLIPKPDLAWIRSLKRFCILRFFLYNQGKGSIYVPLTPQDFVSKWKRVTAREKQPYNPYKGAYAEVFRITAQVGSDTESVCMNPVRRQAIYSTRGEYERTNAAFLWS